MTKSRRLLIKSWTKSCRSLYKEVGVYAVYDSKDNRCLYIGQSTDLGKRLRRFFNKGLQDDPINPKRPVFVYIGENGLKIKHCPIYIEVTTIVNHYHLDSFERTMISIKAPLYNKLMNYNRPQAATIVPNPLFKKLFLFLLMLLSIKEFCKQNEITEQAFNSNSNWRQLYEAVAYE